MAYEYRFQKHQRGVTLVELVMTIVIISVVIAGVVGAFSLMAGRSADPLNQIRAVALAQRYMDEILSKPFDERAPVGGRYDGGCESTPRPSGRGRDELRDVDDYDGLEETPSKYWNSGAIESESGYEQFTVDIVASCDDSLGITPEPKRIDITIKDPSGNNYLFSAYRGNS
ncbi:MAG: prepilin-type N-terminal cleavage/methylation domain-containing protein [Marinobacter sp.]